MRYIQVFNALSILMACFTLTMFFPLGVAIYYQELPQEAFTKSIVVALLCVIALWSATKKGKRELSVRDGFLLVASTWIVLPFLAAFPLYFHIQDLSFLEAYFEAVSGLTATGASVITALDHMPLSINLWRTQLNWLGGMGIIVLAVAILPMLGIGGRQMFKAEATGPIKESQLTPRIAETAKGLWLVYLMMTAVCTFALFKCGMSGWDALMHAFSTMGLGGFSSKDAGLGYFNSLAVNSTVMFFALMSGINFATHFLALRGCSLKPYLNDVELPVYLGGLVFSIMGIALYLVLVNADDSFLTTLYQVAFHSISLATSLGFTIHDYTNWPIFTQFWMLSLCAFLACAGSTGGGIKTIRAIILFKLTFREILIAMHPVAVKPVYIRKMPIPDGILHSVLAFAFVYILSIILLTFLQLASGLDPVTALSSILACINNTGPGLNLVGPASNYQVLNDFQMIVCIFAMILGRLEIFTLLVIFTPAFWRK